MGNTPAARGLCCSRWAHPHGRGEHNTLSRMNTHTAGSSPRAWGTPTRSLPPWWVCGLIPTGVGNTQKTLSPANALTAHPHGRGEHPPLAVSQVSDSGSSPRAWGTLWSYVDDNGVGGLIPTGVGNTNSRPRRSRSRRAHPHGRGEHFRLDKDGQHFVGSSPRAWGTLHVAVPEDQGRGLIPTGVGNTTVRAACRPVERGSSPRAWGTRTPAVLL